jgi:epoxyqueuosine reductase
MPNSISEKYATALATLRDKARAEGLPLVKVSAAALPDEVGARLDSFIADQRHGDMAWLAETQERRRSPLALWPEARTAIVFAQPYTPAIDPMARLANRSAGTISVYALNRDYHDLFKGKLKRLAQWLAHSLRREVKVFVDTAPLMEKPLAAQAGLGWQGKHTNLVSREAGNWFFIGTILTTAVLPHDAPEADHCGTCRACLDACPTKAFPAPYQLDARRCISYLTIEHHGPIPLAFRRAMGNRIYGCDDCLAVCPWNKFAHAAQEAKLQAREELVSPNLSDLLQLDDFAFRALFSGSAVKRIGRDRFIRNCLVAAGNSDDPTLIPIVTALLTDPSPVVRGAAVWALHCLDTPARFADVRAKHAADETDGDVRMEWTRT